MVYVIIFMSDNRTKEQRSYNMSRIRSKNTKPEILVRKYLYAKSYRYRVNYNRLPGKPDIVLTTYKTIIFIHGCFWHSHENCKYAKKPASNSVFWEEKTMSNKLRDSKNVRVLKEFGWDVIVIWECELKKDLFEHTMANLLSKLLKN